MINKFIFSALLTLLCLRSYSAIMTNVPVILTQPNGIEIQAFETGDEFYIRVFDSDNFTIIMNEATGYYEYAVLTDGKLTASGYIAGVVNPNETDLQKGVSISDGEYQKIRKNNKAYDFTEKNQDLSLISTGVINNIVVFIRFSDQAEFSADFQYINSMFNDTAAGANSMRNYFKECSYNTLTTSTTFYPAPQNIGNSLFIVSFQDSHPRSYYSPFQDVVNPDGYHNDTERWTREQTCLSNGLNSIINQIPAGLNLDFNNDNKVDNVCFIIKGATTAWNTLLWPHKTQLLVTPAIMINNKQVYDYNIQIEEHLLDNSHGVGVLCHEMNHTLGAPDLYRNPNNTTSIVPVGPWDIMAQNTNPPQSMGAFMKNKYGGWISSIPLITSSGTYTLNPVTSGSNNCYKIISPYSSSEFFILEYRKKEGVFENSIPASGLIITRINTAAGNGDFNGPPDEIYIYRENGTTTADGEIDQATFGAASGRTSFDNSTNPNCFFSNGNLGGINITNIGAPGPTISFQINLPDLIVQNTNISVTNIVQGATTNVSCVIKNQGSAAPSASILGYYLSPTSAYNSATAVLLGSENIPALDAEETYPQSEVLTVPVNTSPGTHFILFVADANNQVSESDETNNVAALQVLIKPTPENCKDTITLSASGSGEKFVDGSNFTQYQSYDLSVSLTFEVYAPVVQGDFVNYSVRLLSGTFHHTGHAEDYFYGSTTTLNFDYTHNFFELQGEGSLSFSVADNKIYSLDYFHQPTSAIN
ncbi:MAG: M6 family metalloprotease domain-containing protein, partial [Bacteroidetes bacterium]|nr:M6 family metalloprotease domain-containing protein [Bacteroidota bacterium]